eukprot:scaffold2939_cov406-Prasinococcus_capsulatus_cf.AAC.2
MSLCECHHDDALLPPNGARAYITMNGTLMMPTRPSSPIFLVGAQGSACVLLGPSYMAMGPAIRRRS